MGSAGAVCYRLPKDHAAATVAMTDVYGYLLAHCCARRNHHLRVQGGQGGRCSRQRGKRVLSGAGGLVLRAEQRRPTCQPVRKLRQSAPSGGAVRRHAPARHRHFGQRADGVVDRFLDVQLASAHAGPHVQPRTVAVLHVNRPMRRSHHDAADVLVLQRMKDHLDCVACIAAQFGGDRGHQHLLKSVAVGLLQGRVIVLQAGNASVVRDADQQGAAIAVHVAGKRLQHHGLKRAIDLVLAQVPSKRGLELQVGAFAASDQRAQVAAKRGAQLLDPLGAPMHGRIQHCCRHAQHHAHDRVEGRLLRSSPLQRILQLRQGELAWGGLRQGRCS